MALYSYTARDKSGRPEQGRVDAASEQLAINILQSRGLIVTGLSAGGTAKTSEKTIGLSLFNRVKEKDVVVFSRQLSILIAAGVPLLKAVRLLGEQVSSDVMRTMLMTLATDVEGGLPFSAALARFPSVFSPFYINMVRSGEASGRLDELLDRLATQLDKDFAMKAAVRNALIYPIFIVTAIIGVGILMMIFVIPQITQLLIDANVDLPLTTKIIIWVSDLLVNFWWVFLLLVIGGIIFLQWYRKTPDGRLVLDRVLITLPIVGVLVRKIAIVRFSRNLSTLVQGDLPIIEALGIIAPLVDNAVYERQIREAKDKVTNGIPLSEALTGEAGLMPDMVTQMVAVGERTGKLGELLERVAEFFNRDVDDMIKNLTVLIEPVVIILLGIAIGVMISAVLLPIYQYSSSI